MTIKKGFFGEFGGAFVHEILLNRLKELDDAYEQAIVDTSFQVELEYYQKQYIGRNNPLYYAENLTKLMGGAKIYFKREDLNHTGSHKINNAIGQALLAKRMKKTRIVAETGAGQHGVATATVCALMNMDCTIYMGEKDMERQKLNVFRMRLLGANVIAATTGQRTLKDAVDAALNDYATHGDDTFYLLGSAVGPHPYPTMVKYFQRVIGDEVKEQILEVEGKLPNYLVACVGGGSNAIGLFSSFYDDKSVKFIGVEPAGKGLDSSEHAATLTLGTPGDLHGFRSYNLQDNSGKPLNVHSIAPGLDYPSVGPEHSYYKDINRCDYTTISDDEALDAFLKTSRNEGIIPALESSHAIGHGLKLASTLSKDEIIVINISGRGDKDVNTIMENNYFNI